MTDPDPAATAPPADPDPKPPRNRAPDPRQSHARKPGAPTNLDKLTRSLTDQYVFLGGAVFMVSPGVGAAILESSQNCAAALAAYAMDHPKVREVLERMMTGAGLAAVVGAHAPIAKAIYDELAERRTTGAPLVDERAMSNLATAFTAQPAA